jgi:acyl carrier protein
MTRRVAGEVRQLGREDILDLINLVLTTRELEPVADADLPLREVGFRSLDFSEVALRLEDELGYELNFEASTMRRIGTIRDVIDFFVEASLQTDVHRV